MLTWNYSERAEVPGSQIQIYAFEPGKPCKKHHIFVGTNTNETMLKALVFIPARYGSTRFPGKPLTDINGKSMIMRVYEQALKAEFAKDVVVATDDQRIYDHILANGGKVVMTSEHHNSGTERCLEAYQVLMNGKAADQDDIILNLQGDEPFVKPQQIDSLIETFSNPKVHISTLIRKIESREEFVDPNCVKVIVNLFGQALYFSRAAIPYHRDENAPSFEPVFRHIGMYAYRASVLREICSLAPSRLELAEKLEQLRWLENGYTIHVQITDHESVAIDTPADLLKVTNIA